MSAPDELYQHGSLATPVLVSDRIRYSLKGLDEGEQDWACADHGVFIPGGVHPSYPGLRIQEVDERTEPGRILATIRCSGLKAGKTKRIGLQWSQDPFGFDVATEERIERTDLPASDFTWAAALTGFSNMLLVGSVGQDEMLDGRWCKRSLQYRGIKKTGLVSRKCTVNENIVSPGDAIAVDLTNPTLSGTYKVQVSMPRIVLVEVIKSASAPDLTAIPGSAGATPVSGVAFPSIHSAFSLTGDLTYNWPYGWKISSIDPEYLHAGSNINVTTYTYEYVWPTQF